MRRTDEEIARELKAKFPNGKVPLSVLSEYSGWLTKK